MYRLPSTPVAIIGMACHFPGNATTVGKLWNNILNKRDCISPIPAKRWNSAVLSELKVSPATDFAKVGGFIEGIDEFDAAFFGISPKEAQEIDPQQRILLELAWRCIEDAAVSNESLLTNSTGVYVGVINHDYERMLLANGFSVSSYTGLGRSAAIAANRISYCFDLKGPSVTIDTACSSSLTAVDSACQALACGDAQMAFAGGANAILLPESYIEFSRASMLSKSGKCHAFDQQADGFVRAEGGGMVLLKRLSDALTDGDRIYAVIASTCINQDGKTAGLMAPSIESQVAMMRETLDRSGLCPHDVGYVEAHGTGTQAGDAAEISSLSKIYGQDTRTQPCFVGSVKTNIGHTESAAGIAGLIKAALAVNKGVIPPNINFSQPNPNIEFASLQVPVNTEPWPETACKSRVAAVNSFGFGGSNASCNRTPGTGHYRSEHESCRKHDAAAAVGSKH